MGNTTVRINGKPLYQRIKSSEELKVQMEQFEATNQATQLRSAQGRLKRYQELLEKIRSL